MTKQNRKHKKNINETEKIKNTIRSNETATKKLLQQRHFQKFTSLKYKPTSAAKTAVNNNEKLNNFRAT